MGIRIYYAGLLLTKRNRAAAVVAVTTGFNGSIVATLLTLTFEWATHQLQE